MNETVRITSVTGVDLALKLAGPGARSYAFIIDWHIRALLAAAWWILGTWLMFGELTWAGSNEGRFLGYAFTVLLPSGGLYLLYHPVLEVVMHGRTPGKRMAGVRVVAEDGGIASPTSLLIRNVLRLLDSQPGLYVVGLVATLVTRNAVRVGDMVAGTLLVYEDLPRGATAAALASDRDAIARHGLDRADLARELLERWRDLAPDVRSRLSRRLLAEIGDPPATGADDLALLAQLQAHVRG